MNDVLVWNGIDFTPADKLPLDLFIFVPLPGASAQRAKHVGATNHIGQLADEDDDMDGRVLRLNPHIIHVDEAEEADRNWQQAESEQHCYGVHVDAT